MKWFKQYEAQLESQEYHAWKRYWEEADREEAKILLKEGMV